MLFSLKLYIYGALVAFLVACIVAASLRKRGAAWARLPPPDQVVPLLLLAGVYGQFDWNKPSDKLALEIMTGILCAVVGLWVLVRLFPPKPSQRPSGPTPQPKDMLTRGPYRGWSARVARQHMLYTVVFVAAGVSAGILISKGQSIFGGVARRA